jgi:hypothetical protein
MARQSSGTLRWKAKSEGQAKTHAVQKVGIAQVTFADGGGLRTTPLQPVEPSNP